MIELGSADEYGDSRVYVPDSSRLGFMLSECGARTVAWGNKPVEVKITTKTGIKTKTVTKN